MTRLQLEISNQYDSLACPIEATQTLIHAIESSGEFPIAPDELSIAFVNDMTIAKVHETFMEDPSAMDMIIFPADPAMHSAGEIIVSVDHAGNQAKALKEPFSRELSLYLLHGWLNLVGYNDQSEEEQAAMRKAEQRALTIADQSSVRQVLTFHILA